MTLSSFQKLYLFDYAFQRSNCFRIITFSVVGLAITDTIMQPKNPYHPKVVYPGFFSALFWRALTTTRRKFELGDFLAELGQNFA